MRCSGNRPHVGTSPELGCGDLPQLFLPRATGGTRYSQTWRSLVRSEPLIEPPLPTRRSKREHIDAMGRLIASSDEEAWVVQQVLGGVQAEVRQCLRLDPSTPLDSVLDFLRRSDKALADRFHSLVLKAPKGSGDRASKAAAVDWGRMSHAFLRDLHASRKAGARSHKTAPHP